MINDTVLKQQLEYIDREIAELQGSLLNVAENEQDPIALLEYAEGYLKNPSIFWKKSKLHTKLKLQWFEFPSGIVFENEKFRTIKLANVFNVKTASCDTVSTSVDPRRIELLTSESGKERLTPGVEGKDPVIDWPGIVSELHKWSELMVAMAIEKQKK